MKRIQANSLEEYESMIHDDIPMESQSTLPKDDPYHMFGLSHSPPPSFVRNNTKDYSEAIRALQERVNQTKK